MGNYNFSNKCRRKSKLLRNALKYVKMVLDELMLEGNIYVYMYIYVYIYIHTYIYFLTMHSCGLVFMYHPVCIQASQAWCIRQLGQILWEDSSDQCDTFNLKYTLFKKFDGSIWIYTIPTTGHKDECSVVVLTVEKNKNFDMMNQNCTLIPGKEEVNECLD